MTHVIDLHLKQQKKQKSFVKMIFNAADLNFDGSLQYLEAEILVRHISERAFDREWFKQIFKTNSDLVSTEDEST